MIGICRGKRVGTKAFFPSTIFAKYSSTLMVDNIGSLLYGAVPAEALEEHCRRLLYTDLWATTGYEIMTGDICGSM